MSELERLYREAPKLKSPAHLDKNILQSAQDAARVSTGLRVDEDKRQSLFSWKPGLALASLCTVGIGIGIAMHAGTRNSAPSAGNFDVVQLEPVASRREEAELSVAANQTLDLPEVAGDAAMARLSEVTTPTMELSVAEVTDEAVAVMRESDTVTLADQAAVLSRRDAKATDSDAMGGELVEEILAERLSDREVSMQVPRQMRKQSANAEGADALAARAIAQRESRSVQRKSATGQADVNRWLLVQNSTHYSIQIAVKNTESALDSVAEKFNHRTEKVIAADTQWVLLHGSFNQRQQAEEALIVILNDAEKDDSLIEIAPKIVRIGEMQNLLK